MQDFILRLLLLHAPIVMLVHGQVSQGLLLQLNVRCAMLVHGQLLVESRVTRNAKIVVLAHGPPCLVQHLVTAATVDYILLQLAQPRQVHVFFVHLEPGPQ